MMENLMHDKTRIGHNRLKLVGIKNFMDDLGCFLKNLQSDQPKEARGQS